MWADVDTNAAASAMQKATTISRCEVTAAGPSPCRKYAQECPRTFSNIHSRVTPPPLAIGGRGYLCYAFTGSVLLGAYRVYAEPAASSVACLGASYAPLAVRALANTLQQGTTYFPWGNPSAALERLLTTVTQVILVTRPACACSVKLLSWARRVAQLSDEVTLTGASRPPAELFIPTVRPRPSTIRRAYGPCNPKHDEHCGHDARNCFSARVLNGSHNCTSRCYWVSTTFAGWSPKCPRMGGQSPCCKSIRNSLFHSQGVFNQPYFVRCVFLVHSAG